MAKKSAIISVAILGDNKKLKKALGGATESLKNFGKRVGQVSATAGAALGAIGVKAGEMAVDFEESLSKSQAIFETASKSIEANAKGAATAVGLSQSEFLEAASSFGVFGKAAGLSGDDLATFSSDLVTVAADVASFNNLRPEEALEKLQAGLRGSNEPLQSIGVLINAAAIEAKALEMGLGDANGEISEGNKIMARQALILEQLGQQGALGDFSKTSEGLANQQRILKARIKNLGIELGKKLLPIGTKIFKLFDKLISFGEKLSKVYGKKGFAGVAKVLVDGLINMRQKIFDTLRTLAPKVGQALLEIAPVLAEGIWTITKAAAKNLLELGKAFIDWIVPLLPSILKKLGEWGKTVGNWILYDGLPLVADNLGKFAAAFLDWIGPVLKELLIKLPDIAFTITEFIITKAIPEIAKAGFKLAEHLVPALLSFAGDVITGLAIAIGDIAKTMGTYAVTFLGIGADFALNIIKGLGQKLSALLNWFKDLPATIGQAFSDAFGNMDWTKIWEIGYKIVAEIGRGIINAPTDLMGLLADKLPGGKNVWKNVLPAISGIPGGIPLFAKGGIVTQPTLGIVGEAGPEAVIPLNKAGMMGGNTININMPAGSNGDDVVRALQRYQAINGPIPVNTRAF